MKSVVPLFQALKFKHFGHDAIILHEREIRKQQHPFECLVDRERREEFMDDLTEALRRARFQIIASVIDKRKLRDEYLFQDNPYSLALQFCLEKSFRYLATQNQADRSTHCIFERRGEKEDKDLELEFFRITGGANTFRHPLPNFQIRFVDKRANSSGMQIADLTARPIGLSILRPEQANRAFDVIRKKICRLPGDRRGSQGLRVFP